MKKIVLVSLFVFGSLLANAQNFKTHPKKPYSPTDSCLVWQDSTKRFYRIKCSEINTGGSSAIDTTKVGRIEQGRGTAPIFMYFNGVAWVKNDTSYIPREGADNISGNLFSINDFFQLGLTNNNNRIRFDDEYSTDLYSKNSSTDKEARLTLGSYGDGEIGLGINHPTTGLQRRLVISGATSSTPNNTFLFDKGLAYYGGDYRSEMTTDVVIPDIGKVKQLISDSVGTAQSTTLADGKIWIGDGTNTAFPRTLSGDVTVDNLGVTSYNGVVPNRKLTDSVSKLLPEVGTIISESWTNLSSWTQEGTATWGVASNILTATGGTPVAPVFTNYIRNSGYGNSCYSLYKDEATIIVGTINSTSWGVYLGVQGQSSFFPVSVHAALMLDATNKGKIRLYNQNTNTVLLESDGTLSVTAGDNITLSYVQNYNQLVVTAYNITTNRRNVLTVTQQQLATYNLNSNVYQHSIGIMGGTHQILPYTSYVHTKKNLDWLFWVDSIGWGSSSSNYSTDSFIKMVADAVHDNIDVYGGPGLRIQDVVAAEVNLISATNNVVQVGTNNVADGDNAATLVGRITTIRSSITGAVQGTNFFEIEIMPKGVTDVSGYATQYASTFTTGVLPSYLVMKASSGTGLATNFASSDGLHLSNYGHSYFSGVLLEALPFQKKNHFSVNDSKVSYVGNKVVLGNIGAYNPKFLFEAIGSTTNSQVAISSNTTTGAGMTITSASDDQALIMGGGKYQNGVLTATATTVAAMNCQSGDVTFFSGTGQTVGSAIVTANKMIIKSNGLVQIPTQSLGSLNVGNSANNAFTYAGTTYYSDALFENGNTVTSGNSCNFYNGAMNMLVGNGTNRVSVAQIGFSAVSTAGFETGDLLFSTKQSGSSFPSTRMRILSTGNIGIGTSTPQSKLDVEGAVAIGATYSGTTAAPANGLLVEGLVGIGTSNPTVSLDVSSKTDAIRIANGTTAQRTTAASGLFRFNTTTSRFEGNDGTNWNTFTESIFPIMCSAPSSTYAASTTYYMGSAAFTGTLTSTANQRVMQIPFNATLIGASIGTRSGTPGSSETSTVYMRVNNTTDVQLTNTMSFASANTNQYTSALNTDVSAGDTYEVKLTTGAFTAAPATSFVTVMLYFKRR